MLGALSLECEDAGAFDQDDLNTLQALAELAVIAIHNARQYDDLKQTKGRVGAQTALAWMGMASSTWGHALVGTAAKIRDLTSLLRNDLERELSADNISQVKKRLATIERLVLEILESRLLLFSQEKQKRHP